MVHILMCDYNFSFENVGVIYFNRFIFIVQSKNTALDLAQLNCSFIGFYLFTGSTAAGPSIATVDLVLYIVL